VVRDSLVPERATSERPTLVSEAVSSDRVARLIDPVTVAAYAVLGALLLLTRFANLGESFWTDEIIAVREYIRAGPSEILAGPELSHELFGLLGWATSSLVGESEAALRLWSVVPFVLGVAVGTVWIHRRLGALSGLLFLFFATASPLLVDITRQARGYGLAFLAMTIVLVAALESTRSNRTWAVAVFCAGGLVGTWTLPQFAVAFLATGASLLVYRALRWRVAVGLGVSLLAIGAWYLPHVDAFGRAADLEDGVQIQTLWLLTAPIDQVLLPGLIWIDGTALIAGAVWLPLVVVALLLIGSSPLLHDRRIALVVVSGALSTVLFLWIGDAYVIPRYLSYLLVPSFVLLASGTAAVLERLRTQPAVARTLVAFAALGLMIVNFGATVPDVVRFPREANADAAAIVAPEGLPASRVLVYARRPENIAFYLGRPVSALESKAIVRRVCGSREPVAYVEQLFALPAVDVPCLERDGIRHYRFEQYARGGETNVWLVPPAP
jgi:hypothetical protein